MEDILILYSGGADSRLLLELTKKLEFTRIGCLLIDYKQLHIKELELAKDQIQFMNDKDPDCKRLINTYEVKISGLNIRYTCQNDKPDHEHRKKGFPLQG